MAVLLSDNFENGADSVDLSTSNSVFINFFGTPAKFSASSVLEGNLAMRAAVSNQNSISRVDFSAQSQLWISFYIYISTSTSLNTFIANWRGGSTVVGEIGLQPDNTLRIRDANVQRWLSTPLATGEWHRVSIKVVPGSVSGHELKIYSGANLHTMTPSQQSGAQTATLAGASTVDSAMLGVIVAATADVSFDRYIIADSDEPGPFDPPATITSWSGDGLAAGSLTTSSAGLGDTPFDVLTGTGQKNIVATGPRSPQIELVQASGDECALRWSLGSPRTEGAFRFYWTSPTAWPANSFAIYRLFNDTSAPLDVNVMINGGIRMIAPGGVVTAVSSAGVIQLNTRYRIEGKIVHNGGSGTAELAVYGGESTTTIASISGGGDYSTDHNQVRFGNSLTTPTVGAMYYDDMAISDKAEFIGPYGGATPPSGGLTVTVWDGTQRLPATIRGVWDGTSVVPASFKQTQ